MTQRLDEIKARLEAATMGRHEAQQCLAQCALGSQNCHACPALGCGDNMAHGDIAHLLAEVERLEKALRMVVNGGLLCDEGCCGKDCGCDLARAALEEEE